MEFKHQVSGLSFTGIPHPMRISRSVKDDIERHGPLTQRLYFTFQHDNCHIMTIGMGGITSQGSEGG